ncbi:MAG TPA: GNAT family N-acetyltransferase [Ideonella sp.]|uniref:GNAT family N-acetyltransferase n=1 Tax=Ideonella sp. TaxID=1929293 RepID=UPI002C0D47AA|nr:GNAT family N-acetyltransferase [Ideonella sp.]HSI47498.1 GNAT family N-acetyltransferase [Ideonella sp.]
MPTLRQAVRADLPGIWAVRYAVTENTLTPGRILDDEVVEAIEQTGRGWVVEQQGAIVAFAIGNAKTGNIWALFVHPSAQGLGHGGRLHDEMLAWLQSLKLRSLWLTTGVSTRARAFYERKGWRPVGAAGGGW